MNDEWYNCNDCDHEFRVIGDGNNIEYCPYCGSDDITSHIDEEEDE
jgi:DNA-directed RNA polymerase subunit RPC12/RpoP